MKKEKKKRGSQCWVSHKRAIRCERGKECCSNSFLDTKVHFLAVCNGGRLRFFELRVSARVSHIGSCTGRARSCEARARHATAVCVNLGKEARSMRNKLLRFVHVLIKREEDLEVSYTDPPDHVTFVQRRRESRDKCAVPVCPDDFCRSTVWIDLHALCVQSPCVMVT